MSNYIEIFKEYFSSLPGGVKGAEVEQSSSEVLKVEVKQGKLNSAKTYYENAYYLRTIGEKTGYAHTESTEVSPRKLISRAVEASEIVQTNSASTLNAMRLAKEGVEYTLVPYQTLVEKGAELETKLFQYGKGHVRLGGCSVTEQIEKTRIINSNEMDVASSRHFYKIELDAIARDGEIPHDFSVTEVAQKLDEINIDVLARRAVSALDILALEKPITAGKYNLVLLNQTMQKIITSFWQMFSAEKMQSNTSYLSGKIGKQIGSQLLTIRDVPQHKSGYSFAFDCEGTPSQEKDIVSAGVYETALHNSETAAKEGRVSTGNAGRKDSYGRTNPNQIVVVPNNLYIKPGEKTLDELLAQMGDGLLITEPYDIFHTFQVSSGDFSIPCCSVIIKNGRPAGAASQITISGNISELFNNLEAVGNDLVFDDFIGSFCTGSPSLLVKNISVSLN